MLKIDVNWNDDVTRDPFFGSLIKDQLKIKRPNYH